MAFASTIDNNGVPIAIGTKFMTTGTYSNGSGDTGGNIDTGLKVCEAIFLQPKGAAVVANNPVVNETLPVAGSAITVVTTDNEDGTWMAIGY